MAKIRREQTSQKFEVEGYEGRFEDLDGYTVAFERYSAHAHPVELFRGLPDDRCQCPHWGVVVKGRLVYHYADGTTDEISEGEAYYARPGHTPELFADTEVIEFSPTTELMKTVEVVTRNVEAASA